MANRRMLKGVINGFLGTYTSRYTAYQGYWLFGFLIAETPLLQIDLLGDRERRGRDPVELSRCLAVRAFADQRAKAHLRESCVRRAGLAIRVLAERVEEVAGGSLRRGNHVSFDVEVESDHGKTYRATRKIFVAPHDPAVEMRSTRSDEEPAW
jgi:hypothetical protein